MNKGNTDYLKIKSKPKYFVFLALYYFLYPISKLLYGRKRNWIICERGNDAQDNGYFFFKYLIEKHKEIQPIYLIKKDSKDYQKVSSLGRVVEFASFKHLLLIIGSPVKISTHLFGYAPWIQLALYYRRHRSRDKHIFLQHGITKNYQKGFLFQNCKSLSTFICGAKPEYDYIHKEFGYAEGIVQYTGFARFDSLVDTSHENNIILVMPTWRRYIEGLSDDDFRESMFFHKWNEFLNNESLIQACLGKDIKVIFYLHPSIQKYSHLFKDNSVVTVLANDNVQELLESSKLLITDFSSVYFDFAYMKKPVVYFQFDEEQYYAGHYDRGYFDYRKDGFGPVCTETDTAVESTCKLISNEFLLPHNYLKRIDNTFPKNDAKNCDHIFAVINS